MKEPAKVVAAIEIAKFVRNALADAVECRQSTGWDDEVLSIELGRILGAMLRWQDARPSVVEQAVASLRRVHVGLMSHQTPDAEEAVREFCPQTHAETGSGAPVGGSPTVQ